MAPQVVSGIKNLRLLKSSKATFAGFHRDEFTTLQENYERVLRLAWNHWTKYRMINGHCCILAQTWVARGSTRTMRLILITMIYGRPLKGASWKAGVEIWLMELCQHAFSSRFKRLKKVSWRPSRKSAPLKCWCRTCFMLITISQSSRISKSLLEIGKCMFQCRNHLE